MSSFRMSSICAAESGIEVKVRATYVYTMHDGLCVRWRIYQEHAEALEAAGLRE